MACEKYAGPVCKLVVRVRLMMISFLHVGKDFVCRIHAPEPGIRAFRRCAVRALLCMRSVIAIRGREDCLSSVIAIRGKEEGRFIVRQVVLQIVAAVREDRSLDVDTVLVLSVFNERGRWCAPAECPIAPTLPQSALNEG